jgi:YD repeat-containing protein
VSTLRSLLGGLIALALLGGATAHADPDPVLRTAGTRLVSLETTDAQGRAIERANVSYDNDGLPLHRVITRFTWTRGAEAPVELAAGVWRYAWERAGEGYRLSRIDYHERLDAGGKPAGLPASSEQFRYAADGKPLAVVTIVGGDSASEIELVYENGVAVREQHYIYVDGDIGVRRRVSRGTVDRTHDAAGRLEERVFSDFSASVRRIRFAYDALGNLTSETWLDRHGVAASKKSHAYVRVQRQRTESLAYSRRVSTTRYTYEVAPVNAPVVSMARPIVP